MRRILFVDDEPNVIDGLRRMLRKERREWDMEFAGSGPAALELLENKPFDVIVTDLQMPGMNGAQLLEKVVEAYPDMVRIVLSGHADERSTTRAMRVVHQFLSKPTDAETLKTAVARACGTQSTISDERIRAAVARCDMLPSLPALYVEITQALTSDTSSAKEIARLISRDVALSAKILQLVNSSFFGLGRRISSIDQTVSLLGTIRLKALVLTESILKQFAPPANLPDFSSGAFWSHCTHVAEVARLISKAEGQTEDRPDQAFTAGLLHDLGKLIFATQFTHEYGEVLRALQGSTEPVCEVEMRVLGVTHAEVGAYLLGLWALPPRIIEAVAFHHAPGRVAYDGMCAVTAVHAANVLVNESDNPASDGPPAGLDLAYLERLKLAHRTTEWLVLAKNSVQNGQVHPMGV